MVVRLGVAVVAWQQGKLAPGEGAAILRDRLPLLVFASAKPSLSKDDLYAAIVDRGLATPDELWPDEE